MGICSSRTQMFLGERTTLPGKDMCFWPLTAMDSSQGYVLGGSSSTSLVRSLVGCSSRPSTTSKDQFLMCLCARIHPHPVQRLSLSIALANGVLVKVLRITSLDIRPWP